MRSRVREKVGRKKKVTGSSSGALARKSPPRKPPRKRHHSFTSKSIGRDKTNFEYNPPLLKRTASQDGMKAKQVVSSDTPIKRKEQTTPKVPAIDIRKRSSEKLKKSVVGVGKKFKRKKRGNSQKGAVYPLIGRIEVVETVSPPQPRRSTDSCFKENSGPERRGLYLPHFKSSENILISGEFRIKAEDLGELLESARMLTRSSDDPDSTSDDYDVCTDSTTHTLHNPNPDHKIDNEEDDTELHKNKHTVRYTSSNEDNCTTNNGHNPNTDSGSCKINDNSSTVEDKYVSEEASVDKGIVEGSGKKSATEKATIAGTDSSNVSSTFNSNNQEVKNISDESFENKDLGSAATGRDNNTVDNKNDQDSNTNACPEDNSNTNNSNKNNINNDNSSSSFTGATMAIRPENDSKNDHNENVVIQPENNNSLDNKNKDNDNKTTDTVGTDCRPSVENTNSNTINEFPNSSGNKTEIVEGGSADNAGKEKQETNTNTNTNSNSNSISKHDNNNSKTGNNNNINNVNNKNITNDNNNINTDNSSSNSNGATMVIKPENDSKNDNKNLNNNTNTSNNDSNSFNSATMVIKPENNNNSSSSATMVIKPEKQEPPKPVQRRSRKIIEFRRPPRNIYEPPQSFTTIDWLKMNTRDFIKIYGLLYSCIESECTEQNCPEMSAGKSFIYLWSEGEYKNNPSHLPARKYINLMIDWVYSLLDDQSEEETDGGVEDNWAIMIKKIWARAMRLVMHLYWHHWDHLTAQDLGTLMNANTRHFTIFAIKFNLITQRAVIAPVYDLLSQILPFPWKHDLKKLPSSSKSPSSSQKRKITVLTSADTKDNESNENPQQKPEEELASSSSKNKEDEKTETTTTQPKQSDTQQPQSQSQPQPQTQLANNTLDQHSENVAEQIEPQKEKQDTQARKSSGLKQQTKAVDMQECVGEVKDDEHMQIAENEKQEKQIEKIENVRKEQKEAEIKEKKEIKVEDKTMLDPEMEKIEKEIEEKVERKIEEKEKPEIEKIEEKEIKIEEKQEKKEEVCQRKEEVSKRVAEKEEDSESETKKVKKERKVPRIEVTSDISKKGKEREQEKGKEMQEDEDSEDDEGSHIDGASDLLQRYFGTKVENTESNEIVKNQPKITKIEKEHEEAQKQKEKEILEQLLSYETKQLSFDELPFVPMPPGFDVDKALQQLYLFDSKDTWLELQVVEIREKQKIIYEALTPRHKRLLPLALILTFTPNQP